MNSISRHHNIKQYDNTVWVGIGEIGAIVALTAKDATSKNHPKDILRDKNYLYIIALVHLTLNIAFKTRKHFQMAGYWIFKRSKFCFTACLTFASLNVKWSIVQPQFYCTTINSPVRCAFWDSDKWGASVPRCSFYLPLGSSSSCSETISIC